MFGKDTEIDTAGYVRSCLQKEGVQLVHLQDSHLKTLAVAKEHILIVDLFGLPPPQYYLLVDRYLPVWRQAGHLMLYHSESQAE